MKRLLTAIALVSVIAATLALLLSVTWLMPWYAAWLLPFAAIGESRRLRDATLLLTLFLAVVRMPYGAST